ncbi:hypothetical protein [Actinacidiphila paucisporea]|uniref:Uncharacterized protein n=1 Tax=Actinacidiphila paucisporea TaxID=310782 RepID=A0A1M7HAG3_9ACTN|nr:hypothetical protein [Actinacidiphila paucisporea]SHM25425.1 hypothetical protein SAMN05216499_109210 [Actinacidiphila paucisporea]
MNSENVVLTRVHLDTAPETVVLSLAGAASAAAPKPADGEGAEHVEN